MTFKSYMAIAAASLLAMSVEVSAMTYCAGKPSAKGAERKMKLSNCEWYGETNYDTPPLPGKPSSGDAMLVHWGGYHLDCDADINVTRLDVGAGSSMAAENRSIRAKRLFGLGIPSNPNQQTRVEFKNCRMEIGGGMEINFWTHSMGAGMARVIFENTQFLSKGGFVLTIPANGRFKNKTRQGAELIFKGKSNVSFGAGAVVDTLPRDYPAEWIFKLKFEGIAGVFPTLTFDKEADFTGTDIEVVTGKDLKNGKFVLLNLSNKKSTISKPHAVLINGKTVAYGDEVDIGGKKVSINLEPAPNSKDTKTKNDLVLTVK